MKGHVLDFEPVKFLRTHSKNKDNADVQTQVWGCAFEPDNGIPFSPGALTAATCGGNSVCFIDCHTGTVLAKYYTKNQRISLFSLAWSTLAKAQGNILAVGGSMNSIILFSASLKLCVFEEESKSRSNKKIINALCFHPVEKQILFCGSADGVVSVREIKVELKESSPPHFSIQILQSFSTESEVNELSFCPTTQYLLSSCDQGINCFSLPIKVINTNRKDERNWVKLSVSAKNNTFLGNSKSDYNLVDSVHVLKDGLVACKYALHGCIYICDLNQLVEAHAKRPSLRTFEINPLSILTWSNTDNYFMYMGASSECRLLCCGDDRGSLWLYDLPDGTFPEHLNPTAIIPWPTVTDHFNDKKRKLSLEKYDIVVDRVAVHPSGNFIVAVTNNNVVCLWRKINS